MSWTAGSRGRITWSRISAKAIDPVADKLTQIAVLLCLMPMKCWWVVGILVLKEVSIGIMTLPTLHHTGMVYGAGWYGKLCTAVIYLSMFVPDALADGAGLVPVCGCRALRLPDPAGVCEVCHPLRRHSAGGARRRRAEAGMNAPILSFFAAHAPRQALHRGRRRRFFRCPACRAVQIVPGRLRPDEDRLPQVRGDLLTENLNYGELEYDRGPL